jgi:hypothetical protein
MKPVAKTIVSSSCSPPSPSTIESSRTSRIPDMTSSTSGDAIAGYQSLDSRTRLQPMA